MSLWPNIDQLPDEKPLWKIPLSYIDGYNSGCIAQAKADREALGKVKVQTDLATHFEMVREDWDKPFPLILQAEALAAIAAAQIVKGE
jgi:hypothetical protein